MTCDDLITAGFKEFPPSPMDRWERGFQWRVRDQYGTRYFVTVYFWQHSRFGLDLADTFEVEITYNDGCVWQPGRTAMQIKSWPVTDWTPADVLKWGDELWARLSPNYYERDE